MKFVGVLVGIKCRIPRNPVRFASPFTQINQFATLTAERFPHLIFLPGDKLSALRTINSNNHSYIAQQLRRKGISSKVCCGRC